MHMPDAMAVVSFQQSRRVAVGRRRRRGAKDEIQAKEKEANEEKEEKQEASSKERRSDTATCMPAARPAHATDTDTRYVYVPGGVYVCV